MEQRPVPPIFVWDPGDLGVFDSVALAQSALEAIDVNYGAYVAYDADGRRLTLRVEKGPRERVFLFWHVQRESVVIECSEEAASGQAELREILESFLGAVGEDPAQLRQMSLSELESIARRRGSRW